LGDEEEETAVAVETTAETSVGSSTPRAWMDVAVSITAERRDVGVASWRSEASEGSKPGGGSIKTLCPCVFPLYSRLEEAESWRECSKVIRLSSVTVLLLRCDDRVESSNA
jgi:hypothetical protein